jgi:hypothetical protein
MEIAVPEKTVLMTPEFKLASAPAAELTAGVLGADDRALADAAMTPIKQFSALFAAEAIARIPDQLC